MKAKFLKRTFLGQIAVLSQTYIKVYTADWTLSYDSKINKIKMKAHESSLNGFLINSNKWIQFENIKSPFGIALDVNKWFFI